MLKLASRETWSDIINSLTRHSQEGRGEFDLVRAVTSCMLDPTIYITYLDA